MARKNTGVEFEKVVANIQAQVDPSANVSHNQQIVDKLGHSRQFDVVIKGKFAGQEILGVIECKDLSKKVDTPDIEAFVTKAQDINANFKVVVSRRGFTKPAIEKAKHYGIQTLSLIPNEEVNYGFKVGNYWFADIYYWERIAITLLFVTDPEEPITFNAEEVRIGNKRVIDWFTNHLITNHSCEEKIGWVVGVGIEFENAQLVYAGDREVFKCRGLKFHAKRVLAKKQKFVGINGTGFFDWQKGKATMPAQKNIKTDAVQMNFMDWDDRIGNDFGGSGFLYITFVGHNAQFEMVSNAIDLKQL